MIIFSESNAGIMIFFLMLLIARDFCSGEQCGLWASCLVITLFKLINYLQWYYVSILFFQCQMHDGLLTLTPGKQSSRGACSKFVPMKGRTFFQREMITKKQKYPVHWWNSKIFFFRTTVSISTKLGTEHPWVKEIQVCSNEGPRSFPRGDNYEIVKKHWRIKIFLSRTTGLMSTKLCLFPRGNNYQIVKIHWRK